MERAGAAELDRCRTGAVVVVAVVVLDDGVGHAAVEVKSTAVGGAVGLVVVGLVVLDDGIVRVPDPDADGAADVGILLAVLIGH